MEARMHRVHLFGHLAEGVGEVLELAFTTPAQAVRLLEVNFPGFIRRFKDGYYRVRVVKKSPGQTRYRDLSAEQLGAGFSGDLYIIPVATGAASSGRKKGLLGVILGAVLIGAAFFFSGGTLTTALPGIFGATGATFGSIAQLGLGLALNGVAMLLSPTPSDAGTEEQNNSFVFNGPVNVTDQGGVMPCIYGKMMVGTTTVSASVDSELLSDSSITQGAKNSRHVLQHMTASVNIYMGDLAKIEEGATLTKLNGAAVSTSGTVLINIPVSGYGAGSAQLRLAYGTTGESSLIPGFGDRFFSGLTKAAIRASYLSSAEISPTQINKDVLVPFEFTHMAQTYTGTLTFSIGMTGKDTLPGSIFGPTNNAMGDR